MKWYQVTKTIHGRKDLYWQQTYRVGGSVKTRNKYIGPGANPPRMRSLAKQMETVPDLHTKLRAAYDAGHITKGEYLQRLHSPRPAADAFRAAGPFPTALDAFKSPEYKALIKYNKSQRKE